MKNLNDTHPGNDHWDVPLSCVIVGAGQAGLSLAFQLRKAGINPLLIEKDARVGDVWRRRPDNMKLFTSRQFCQLPGFPLTGKPHEYPGKDEIADYLESYVTHHQLDVITGTNVVSVERQGELYEVRCSDGHVYACRTLVNATGANQRAVIPACAQELQADILQLAADQYRNPHQLTGRRKIVVVGDGASGRQIAAELANNNYAVTLFCANKRPLLPNRVLKKDIFWWLHYVRAVYADTNSIIGGILRRRNPIPCAEYNNSYLRKNGVTLAAELTEVKSTILYDCEGRAYLADAVIWTVGYEDETGWLPIDGAVDEGRFCCESGKLRGGLTPLPGLFCIGRKWLSNRASELLMGASLDSTRVCGFVLGHLAAPFTARQSNTTK